MTASLSKTTYLLTWLITCALLLGFITIAEAVRRETENGASVAITRLLPGEVGETDGLITQSSRSPHTFSQYLSYSGQARSDARCFQTVGFSVNGQAYRIEEVYDNPQANTSDGTCGGYAGLTLPVYYDLRSPARAATRRTAPPAENASAGVLLLGLVLLAFVGIFGFIDNFYPVRLLLRQAARTAGKRFRGFWP